MAKGIHFGVGSVARKGKKAYIGVDNVARKVKKAYIGVDGVAKLFWSGANPFYVIYDNNGRAKVYSGEKLGDMSEINSMTFTTSDGVQATLISGDYLFVVGSGYFYRISKDGTMENINPLAKLVSGVISNRLTYYDLKKVGNTLVAMVRDYYSGSNYYGVYVVYSSDNGDTWKYTKLNSNNGDGTQIVHLNGLYYALDFSTRELYYSTDLVSWTSSGVVLSSSYKVYGLFVYNNRLVVVAKNGSGAYLNYSEENPTGKVTLTTKCVVQSSYNLNGAFVENGIIFLPSVVDTLYYGTTLNSNFKELEFGNASGVYHVEYKDGMYMVGTSEGIYCGTSLDSLVLDASILYAKRIVH